MQWLHVVTDSGKRLLTAPGLGPLIEELQGVRAVGVWPLHPHPPAEQQPAEPPGRDADHGALAWNGQFGAMG